ncbi:MAG: hypothetical protein Q8N14_00205 [Candidatus Omnitrophota bacterium]|nr:hypothetical protein [Candidatus Omnitrophota bacterium]
MDNQKEIPSAKSIAFSALETRRRMMSTFAISSLIPILIAFYLNYDKVLAGSRRISIFLFIAVILSLSGLLLLNDIIKSLLKED